MNKHDDEYELLYMLRQKDTIAWDIFLNKYRHIIDYKISEVVFDKHLYHRQKEELRQHGYILLSECLDTYNSTKKAKFSTFFSFCFERRIRNQVRSYYSNGGINVNALSLDQPIESGSELTVGDNVESHYSDFQADASVRHASLVMEIEKTTAPFSTLEQNICQLKQEGYSYQEIMEKLQCSYKKIDNTMQKFRKALSSQLKDCGYY